MNVFPPITAMVTALTCLAAASVVQPEFQPPHRALFKREVLEGRTSAKPVKYEGCLSLALHSRRARSMNRGRGRGRLRSRQSLCFILSLRCE
jgi:hypothetical protein